MSTFSRASPSTALSPLPHLSPLISPRTTTMPLPMTRTPSLLSRGNSYTSADLAQSSTSTPSPELPAAERMGTVASPTDLSDTDGADQSSSEVDVDELETETDSSPERLEHLARSMGLRVDPDSGSDDDFEAVQVSPKSKKPALYLSTKVGHWDLNLTSGRDLKTPTNPQFPLSFVGINVHHPGIDSPLNAPFPTSDRDDLDTPPIHTGSIKTPSNPYFPTIFNGIDLQHQGMDTPHSTVSSRGGKRRARSGDGAEGLREVQVRLEKVAMGQERESKRRVPSGLPLKSPLDMSFAHAATALQIPGWSSDAPKTPVGMYKVELNGINASPHLAESMSESSDASSDCSLKRPGTPTEVIYKPASQVTESPSSMLAGLVLSPPKKARVRPAARTARTFPLSVSVPTQRSLSATLSGGALASPLPRIEVSDAPLPSPTAFEVAQNIQRATTALAARHSAPASTATSPTSSTPPTVATSADAAMPHGPQPIDRSQPVSVFRKRQRRSVDGNMNPNAALRAPIDAEGRRRPNLGGGLKLDLAGMGVVMRDLRVPASVPEGEVGEGLDEGWEDGEGSDSTIGDRAGQAGARPGVGLGIDLMGLGSPCHILTPGPHGPMLASHEVVSPLTLSALSPMSALPSEVKPW